MKEGSTQTILFRWKIVIKDKKIDLIIDNLLSKLYLYDEKFVGNFNGILKIKFDELDNKLLQNGEINLVINEKKLFLMKPILT